MEFIKKTIRKVLNKSGYDIIKIYKKKIIGKEQLFKIGDIELTMPIDHTLPGVLSKFPIYSKNLPRIVNNVRRKYAPLNIIDIGANIGDTVALITEECPLENISFTCIEGDSNYLSYLKKNLSSIKNITIIDSFLSENDEELDKGIVFQEGTARIIDNIKKTQIRFLTLDSLFKSSKITNLSKVLKIDTDGFDLKIIRGGFSFIESVKPIIFIEYDREYLDANQDERLSTIYKLSNIGYKNAIIYDNYGRLLLGIDLSNFSIFNQLDLYIKGKKGAFEYYDICFFHEEDLDLYNSIIEKEILFFNSLS